MELSHSRVEMYRSCPQRYKFRYADRIHEGPRPELEFGSIIHNMLEFLHSPKQLQTPTLDELIAKFEESWAELPELEGLLEYKPLGQEMLRNYYSAHIPLKEKVLAVEQRFRAPLEKHMLVGVLDRVTQSDDGTIVVTDYKTSKKLPTQPEVDSNPQLAIYYHFAKELYPGHPILMRLHYLKFDFLFETRPTEEAWIVTRERIFETASSIESKNFYPSPGWVCDYCDYTRVCPAMRHLFEGKEEQTEVFDDIDINDAVRRYVAVKEEARASKAEAEELAGKIRSYLETKGLTRFFVDNIVIYQSKMTRHEWDEKKLAKTLKDLGLTKKVTGIKEDTVRELLKSDEITPEQKMALKACMNPRYSFSLRYSYRDEEDD